MGFWASLPIIGKIFTGVTDIIDKAVPDKDLREKLKFELQMMMMTLDYKSFEKEIEAKASIIMSETKGASWLQRNWRPILMMVCIVIVANNYIFAPYLSMFTDKAMVLDLPDKLWSLMTVGVGGYIVGRSTEKVVTNVFKNRKGE